MGWAAAGAIQVTGGMGGLRFEGATVSWPAWCYARAEPLMSMGATTTRSPGRDRLERELARRSQRPCSSRAN